MLAGAVNDNPDIPGFMQKFAPSFPVGPANGPAVLQYMQWPAGQRPLVPFMAFIDRKGTIRAQFSGADGEFFGPQEEQNIREQVERLLTESILTKPREQKH